MGVPKPNNKSSQCTGCVILNCKFQCITNIHLLAGCNKVGSIYSLCNLLDRE